MYSTLARVGAVDALHRRDADGRDQQAPLAELLQRQVGVTVVAVARHAPLGGEARWMVSVDYDHLGELTPPRNPIEHRPGELVPIEEWP